MKNGSAFLTITGEVFKDEMRGQARILTVVVRRPKKGADGKWSNPGSFFDVMVWSSGDKPLLAPRTWVTVVADTSRETEGEYKGRYSLKADASSIRVLGYPPRDGESEEPRDGGGDSVPF